MHAVIAWWDLGDSDQTVDSLRDHLAADGVAEWTAVAGLRVKCWLSDRAGNRWGAVMVWERGHPVAGQPLPRNRAAELIGYPPTQRIPFDVEAIIGAAVGAAVGATAGAAAGATVEGR